MVVGSPMNFAPYCGSMELELLAPQTPYIETLVIVSGTGRLDASLAGGTIRKTKTPIRTGQ
jgi:hypothetical protein